MKDNNKGFKANAGFLFLFFLLFFSLNSSGQRNVTTIRINAETIKKKPIVDSLAGLLTKSDLRKADSCIQVIFNAVHRKDTAAEISGRNGLEAILTSDKYNGEVLAATKPGGFLCKLFRCETKSEVPPPVKHPKTYRPPPQQ